MSSVVERNELYYYVIPSGQGWAFHGIAIGTCPAPVSGGGSYYMAESPTWLLVTLTAIPPVLQVFRVIRRRRTATRGFPIQPIEAAT